MISNRIKEIAKLIDNTSSFTDIGCDHGYLALEARKNGNENLIICSDNKIGPLNNAESNLKNYDNILFVLSEGAKEIDVQTDIAVLAGMGYSTAKNIITESLDFFRKCKKIIIQVNQDVSSLRKWLMENGFKIIDEKIVFEYKYYQILVVENGEMKLTEEQILFGPYLLKEKSKTFRNYYHSQIKKIKRIIKKIDVNHPDRFKFEDQLFRIKKMLED